MCVVIAERDLIEMSYRYLFSKKETEAFTINLQQL